MILRKPYAFLIKYFQRINIVLLLCVLFLFYRIVRFHQFAKNYLSTTIYNSKIDSISNYFNITTILSFTLIFIICGILIYLLRKKDKPYISYIFVLAIATFSFGLLIYANTYFNYTAINGYKIVNAKTISDLSFIANLLFYPVILLLLIRSLGIDLKSFGFQEDKEFIEIDESDREEVEVEVGFDKEKWLRKTKYYFRNTKYFIVEHKIGITIAFGIVALIGLIQFYNYYYVANRVYNMNQVISSNSYKLKVRNTYLTDKDYNGNIITHDDAYFVIVDLQIKNTLSRERDFDIEKVLLYVDNSFYVPSTKYNNCFKDMGNLYKGKSIKPKETVSYLLIYQIPKPSKNSNFILKYQDVGNTKLVQIRIKVVDISTFKDKGEQTYPQMFEIPLNTDNTMKFKISGYEIGQSVAYTYQQCDTNGSCPIHQTSYTAPNGKRVLHLKFMLEDKEKDEFINFVYNYGKLKYTVDGEEKEIDITRAFSKKYRGNHIYLVVPDEIEKATNIDLAFTVRTYNYVYHLKGE